MPNQYVSQIFRQYLGREANDYENQGFSDAIDRGILDPIGLSLFLQSSGEYQRRMAPEQAKSLEQALGGSDRQTLDRAYAGAVGKYRQMGRPYSSGLDSSFAQAGLRLAEGRQGQVASYLQNSYGAQGQADLGARGSYAQGFAANRQRGWDVEDRNFGAQQMNSYYDRAMRQSKENQWFQLGSGLLQGGATLGAGAMMRGGYGAMMRGG